MKIRVAKKIIVKSVKRTGLMATVFGLCPEFYRQSTWWQATLTGARYTRNRK